MLSSCVLESTPWYTTTRTCVCVCVCVVGVVCVERLCVCSASCLLCKYICKRVRFLVFGGSLFMPEGVYNMEISGGINTHFQDDFCVNSQ